MSNLSITINHLQEIMNDENIDPCNELPLELFEYCTSLLPFVNVDLLILNEKNQILLSWRDDKHYGAGWQLPGGIIRMKETIDDRIQKTALREIGCEVEYDREPIVVYENIINKYRDGLENQLVRAHNIALLYKCRIFPGYMIDNGELHETDEGYLRWFDAIPENILECHREIQGFLIDALG